MDPQTGKELWRNVRPSGARQESREAFNSPIPFLFPEAAPPRKSGKAVPGTHYSLFRFSSIGSPETPHLPRIYLPIWRETFEPCKPLPKANLMQKRKTLPDSGTRGLKRLEICVESD